MSYTTFDFPNAHMYDSDLRELISMYKYLKDQYDGLVRDITELREWERQHQGEYEELLRRMTIVEGEINTFESEVNRKFNELSIKLQADIQAELDGALAEFAQMFDNLKTSVESDISNMKVEINNLIKYVNDQVANINQNVIEYVNDRLDEFIAHLPDYENLIVYNPVQGRQTNVQRAIYDLYLMFLVYGITAEQYDSLQLTASEFDAKQITAKDYDSYAYNILEYPNPHYYMRDPFTGRIEKNKVVIWKLADLHRLALTAAEYDALEIPAETFDGLQLSAYYFDWYGINLGASAITAGDYDQLEVEAEVYDNKRISAYDYDNYGNILLRI